MKPIQKRVAVVTLACLSTTTVWAQNAGSAATPPAAPPAAAPAGSNLPEVKIIQEQPKPKLAPVEQAAPKPKAKPAPVVEAVPSPAPKPKAKPAVAKAKPATKPKPAPQPAAYPEPQAPQVEVEADAAPVLQNSPYGAAAGAAAAARAQTSSTSPINPSTVLPGDLQGYAGAATRIDGKALVERQPQTTHDALASVPGIVTTSDDGMARHSGIGMRGAPFRRSRKTLVMEDGQTLNQASYIDPSTHYTPPADRIESIEVLRGTVISHGPLNNHGVVNFRNLSPFGANETVIKAAIGKTEESDKSLNNMRHVHTRQNVGNAGVVASYSGSEAGGAWDNEVLRYNDFYGALGLKGSNQDLTISGGYFRQRDRYDELNFIGADPAGTGNAEFFANRHRKGPGFPGADGTTDGFQFSSYNADYYRMMLSHNWYISPDVTLSTKLFGSELDRPRTYPTGVGPALGDIMEARDRQYRSLGADSRIEIANVPLAGAITQDIQAGIHYEQQTFRSARNAGAPGEILDVNNRGIVERLEKYDADAFSAFIQTSIHVMKNLTVTPGVRFESYDLARANIIDTAAIPPPDRASGSQDFSYVLPGVAFAWQALDRTTLYGGYHQGITPAVSRADIFPQGEEKGDNFQIGLRSTAVRGLSFDVAYFHSDIRDYQIKFPFSSPAGDNVFGAVDRVKIDGVEVYGRLESKPFMGGPWNFFGEAVYTYTDSRIAKGGDPAKIEDGNRVPETMRHYANLTLGVAFATNWDFSMSYTYRGGYFTDTENFVGWQTDGDTLTGGYVDDVWLLSARGNLKLTEQLSLFASAQNLTNELYVSDLSDGAKPGQARTWWAGFKYKF